MKVLLGVTGGIAAYLAASAISQLHKSEHDVRVIMTENAQKFITPLTLATLSNHPVMTTMWVLQSEGASVDHIDTAQWADVFVVYPATANIIGKFANGIADDLLSTVFMALPKETSIILFPAMNTNMWNSPVVQENCDKLERLYSAIQLEIVLPKTGLLACGDIGVGKCPAPIEVRAHVDRCKSKYE